MEKIILPEPVRSMDRRILVRKAVRRIVEICTSDHGIMLPIDAQVEGVVLGICAEAVGFERQRCSSIADRVAEEACDPNTAQAAQEIMTKIEEGP